MTLIDFITIHDHWWLLWMFGFNLILIGDFALKEYETVGGLISSVGAAMFLGGFIGYAVMFFQHYFG